MDLQEFGAQMMYFELETSSEVESLIEKAAQCYSGGAAESYLLKAYEMAPKNLLVLVALYRFYFYQNRTDDALYIAHETLRATAEMVDFPGHWRDLNMTSLSRGLLKSFTMVRFYLLALKGAAYLNLKMGNMTLGVEMLNKVIDMDSEDRLGAKILLKAISPVAMDESVSATAA